MRPVWATRLEVYPNPDRNLMEHFDDVVETSFNTVREVAKNHGIEVPMSWRAESVGSGLEERLETTFLGDDACKGWRAVLVYRLPANVDLPEGSIRRAEVSARQSANGYVVVVIRVFIGTELSRIRPYPFNPAPPPLIAALHETFTDIRVGIQALPPYARAMAITDVTELAGLIRNQDRRLPIVVVSRSYEDNAFLIEPDQIAAAVDGVATVAALAHAHLGNTLTRHLDGVETADGAVRIFWPDFMQGEHSSSRLAWSGDRLSGDPERVASLPETIARIIIGAAVVRVGPDDGIWAMLRSQEATRRGELERRSRIAVVRARDAEYELATSIDMLHDVVPLIDESIQIRGRSIAAVVEDLFNKVDAYRKSANDAEKLLTAARKDASDYYEEWQKAQAYYEETIESIGKKSRSRDKQSYMDATDSIQRIWHLADAISGTNTRSMIKTIQSMGDFSSVIITEKAWESLDGYTFAAAPSTIITRLCKFFELAEQYYFNDAPDGLAAMCIDRLGGKNFSPSLNQTQREKYQDQYQFYYDHNDGRGPIAVLADHAIKAKGTKTSNSFRLYWYPDTFNRLFVVHHIGSHLSAKGDTGN